MGPADTQRERSDRATKKTTTAGTFMVAGYAVELVHATVEWRAK